MNIYFKIKYHILGLIRLIFLVLTFRYLQYKRLSKRIVSRVSEMVQNGHIIVVSGSPLSSKEKKYLLMTSGSRPIVLNSYNSIPVLGDVFNKIKDRVILYYQAPWHEPIIKEDYQTRIRNLENILRPDCLVIHNKSCGYNYCENAQDIDFKSLGCLDFIPALLSTKTGAGFVIDLMVRGNVKKITVLGFRADWMIQNQGRGKDFMHKSEWNLFELFNLNYLKKRLEKKNIEIEFIEDSLAKHYLSGDN